MSTVSRICLQCRIGLLNNQRLPSTFLLRSSEPGKKTAWNSTRLQSAERIRSFSTKDTRHTPEDGTKPGETHRRPAITFDPLADPVLIKLTGKAAPLNEPARRRAIPAIGPGVTTADLDNFLEKAINSKTRPSFQTDQQKIESIEEKYDELLPSKEKWGAPQVLLPENKPPLSSAEFEAKFKYPNATHVIDQIDSRLSGKDVVVHGFVRTVRKINKNMCILKLYDFRTGPDVLVQAVSTLTPESTEAEKAAHKALFKLPPFVPVAVSGMVSYTTAPPPPPEGSEQEVIDRWGREMPAHRPEIVLKKLIQLNSVDPTLIYTPETVFPPEKRHLQLRTDAKLAAALRLRAFVASVARHCLQKMGFLEVETPLLFKSTPEGAREFLVPSRNKGHAYALPQSPQQYKQILMASGVARYFQFAKCFRDEDLRADRQPEFTQLDMEVSFARKEDMMKLIQKLMEVVFFRTMNITLPFGFKRMTYTEAMMSYGTDKPDMRHGYLKIHKVILPNKSETLEAFHIRAGTATLTAMTAIHTQFLTTYKSKYSFRSYIAGESSALGIPDVGLTASDIEAINDRLEIHEGDIVILKRRLKPFSGGSTTMGKLRQGLINIAVEHDVIPMPEKALEFLWVYDFPLFSPVTSDEPGQGGLAGLASTHHPFTAPHEEDYDLLATDPLKVRAEHYDLVLNGVELGGGSRRIHDAKLQRYILEEVIRVPKERMGQFEHLIKVLDSGCPPHAGIALGFDRLIAMMSETESIREVIAFPKNSNGVDPLVDSPGKVGEEELAVYGLQLQQQKKERKKKEEKFEYES